MHHDSENPTWIYTVFAVVWQIFTCISNKSNQLQQLLGTTTEPPMCGKQFYAQNTDKDITSKDTTFLLNHFYLQRVNFLK